MPNDPIDESDRPPEQPKPSQPTRPSFDTPGPLRGESWITLQTREAQRLVRGRPAEPTKPAIIGLTRFGSLMSQLYFTARLDDPYVDWWLVQVEETLNNSRAELDELQQQVTALLASMDAIHIEIALSAQPVKVPLQFNNPYSYRAAMIIGSYDNLMCAIMTARHTGFLDRSNAERIKHLGGTIVRRTLAVPTQFPQGIVASREDLRQQSARAQQAIEKYGLPPADILSGERRGELAPVIMSIHDSRLQSSIADTLDQTDDETLDQSDDDTEAL